jgi:hypothetical protein
MHSDPLTSVVRRALRDAPCSTRALAAEAGVPHSTLVRISAGSRNATPAVAAALVKAFRTWAGRCEGLAEAIHNVTPSSQKRG